MLASGFSCLFVGQQSLYAWPCPSHPPLQVVEEIRLLASLAHPNIIGYYEAFCDHDKLCVVTELVQGGDLGSFIRWGSA